MEAFVIRMEGREYTVLLLDTNFLTRIFDQPEARARRLLDRLDLSTTIYAVTLYTVLEVRDRPAAYRRMITLFSWLPVVVLKSAHQLLESEVAAYPNPAAVDPVLFAPVGVRGDDRTSQEEVLRNLFEHPTTTRLMDDLRASRSEILDSLLGLRANFPRPAGGYTADHARDFVWKVCFQQLAFQHLDWVKEMGGERFDFEVDAFPSMKAMAFSTFYRFYPDRQRKPKRSDAFDIASASALPYVDQAALEGNQAEIVRNRIPQADGFLRDLKLWTFRALTDRPSA